MKRKSEWPDIEFRLPNLDELERLSRGEEPEPELRQLCLFDAKPSDTTTAAKVDWNQVGREAVS